MTSRFANGLPAPLPRLGGTPCQTRPPLFESQKWGGFGRVSSQRGVGLAALLAKRLPIPMLQQNGTAMTTPYAGSNITGTSGLIAVDKVANHIRFYDPTSLREIKSFPAPEPAAHELAISHDRRLAFVPLYGDGIYGANKNPNNKVLVIDLAEKRLADVIPLGDYTAPHGMVATSGGKLWVVCDIPNKLLLVDPARRAIEAAYDCPAKGAHLLAQLPDESKLYISSKEGDLAAFDPAARVFTSRVPLRAPDVMSGNGSGSEGLMPTPDGGRLVVIDNIKQRPAGHRHEDGYRDRPRAFADVGALQPEALAARQADVLAGRSHLVVTCYAGGTCLGDRRGGLAAQVIVPVAKGPQGMAFPPDGPTCSWPATTAASSPASTSPTKRAVAAYDGGAGIEVLAHY